MVGYICKYTPVKIIEALGGACIKLEPKNPDYTLGDTFMHPNICMYAKSLWDECVRKNIKELILVNCCDSIRRLYDLLKEKEKFEYIYLIDLPRKNDSIGFKYFKIEIEKFIYSFSEYKKVDITNKDLFKIKGNIKNLVNIKDKEMNIAILGARYNKKLETIIDNTGVKSFNLTCTGEYNTNNQSSNYIQFLFNQFPCMRMQSRNKTNIDFTKFNGIIYHTVKFCDFYSYEYARIRNKVDIPVLKVETDYGLQSIGQLSTRIEAFVESLKNKRDIKSSFYIKKPDKYVAGIDSGSLSTNVVILDNNRNIVSYSVLNTGPSAVNTAKRGIIKALEKTKISKSHISKIISTGYGRVSIPFASKRITEISCHAKGAYYYDNKARTIIDIGGQDSKVISLDDKGDILEFIMNDKCAAGTGRFLEMMAKTLDMSIEEMSRESLGYYEDLKITSMCTVFAESEVVSLIAQNKKRCDIVKALERAVARRTYSLLQRINKKGKYIMTGGVAKNIGVVKAIEEKLKEKLIIPDEPQIIGALGAALYAYEDVFKGEN